uniref:Uncharacterized protein n=1 Tax=Lepeophtheirus salmonis TaxID=72036 RepID=A0A0K2SZR9_LEPSM
MSRIQVIFIRGLISPWKQPIFFCYDCSVTIELLFNFQNEEFIYVVGYVAKNPLHKFPTLGIYTPFLNFPPSSCLQTLSTGALIQPSIEFIENVRQI